MVTEPPHHTHTHVTEKVEVGVVGRKEKVWVDEGQFLRVKTLSQQRVPLLKSEGTAWIHKFQEDSSHLNLGGIFFQEEL